MHELASSPSSVPPPSDHGGAPRTNAKNRPLSDLRSTNQTSANSGTSTVERDGGVFIAAEREHGISVCEDGARVQPPLRKCGTPHGYSPVTPEQAIALRALRSMPTPLSVVRIAKSLGWTRQRVRGWIRFFAAKGLLTPTGKGHVWLGEKSA